MYEGVLEFTGERIVPQADNCEPNFASRMFHEHMARYLFAGQIVAGKAVLDVGCGVGYGSQKLGQLGARSVYAFDISPDAIGHARQFYAHPAVRFGIADAEAFSFDEKFDVITCFEMIEHVNHPDRVLERIARHLRSDGVLVASTPRFLGDKRTHFHVREFSMDEYRDLVGARFKNTKIYSENNHFVSAVTDGAPEQIDRIVCMKDQFAPAQADVFISVSALSDEVDLPAMVPSLVMDDDTYVRMLERDVEILHKAEDDLRAALAVERAAAEDVRKFQEAEIARLVAEYSELFRQSEAVGAERWQLEQDLATFRLAAEQEGAAKEAEIARLVGEYNLLFRRAEQEAAGHAAALRSAAEQAERHAAEVRQLTEDRNTLRTQLEVVVASLKDAEMKFAELQDEQDKLRVSLDALTARANDADARRLEAYEFARASSENAQALRRELDILKSDMREALESPDSVLGETNFDHKHRAIVESMERIFLGTQATHQIARDPLVARVGKLGAELRRLSAELDARQAEACEQRARAEQAEAFAEDWHEQILRLRKTASWRMTAPLRAIGRMFR